MVIQTADGGYALAGSSGYRDSSVTMVKTDQTGNEIWSGLYPGEDEYLTNERGCIREEDDGYTVVSGVFIRIDSLGDTVYTKTYEEILPPYFKCSNLTSDGCYVTCAFGVYVGQNKKFAPQHDYLVFMDQDGELIWADSTFSTDMGYMMYLSEGHGGLVRIGNIWYFDSLSEINYNTRVAEWSIGDLWMTEIGQDTVDEKDNYISRTSDNCYIATGSSITLIKLSGKGEVIWTREIAGEGWFVQELSDGGFIVTGTEDNDLLLIRTNHLGQVEGIAEPDPVTSVTHRPDLSVSVSVGRQIVLHYSNFAQGMSISIFDVSGLKVDEVYSTGQSGTISWGEDYGPGVYFIKPEGSYSQAQKVILIR